MIKFLPLIVIAAAFIVIFIVLTARKPDNAAYKSAIGLALAAAFILIWVSLGVGIFGPPDPHEVWALAIGGIGAIIARFQPQGMARALFATALAQALVGVIALIAGSASPVYWPREIILNGFFVALFVGSALLFRNAAREHPRVDAGSS